MILPTSSYRPASEVLRNSVRALVLWLILIAAPNSGASSGITPKVLLLLSGKLAIYESIAEGEKSGGNGEVKEVILQNSARDVLSEIHKFHPDVVVAVGDAAALWTASNDPGVPVIVSGVIAQSNPKPFSGLTGISLDFPLEAYLETIKKFLPELNRIGLFVNASRNPDWDAEANKAAGSLGLIVNAQSISEETEIGPALQKMNDDKVQLVLLTCDPLVLNPESFKYLIQFSLSHGIGIVVPSSALLKPGGLLSLEADYKDVGKQTTSLLAEHQETSSLRRMSGIRFPRRRNIGVNLKVAKALGVRFSPSAIEEATYEEK